ncbi:MAG: DUF4388 domain-containing protein [Verrucomicrobiales bacterium]|jgi:hypothetical protein|nr:DUF4388 domain-containing protein [Verrucomicrobiales bacterium]
MDIGFAIWPKSTADWFDLGLSSLPAVTTIAVESCDAEVPPPVNLLVIDGDNPGPNFISFYKNYQQKHGNCPLIILGQPNSPALMAIDWDPKQATFIAKPYLIQDVIESITRKVSSLSQPAAQAAPAEPAPKPKSIGYLSKLRLSDLLQMLCMSSWSGKIEAANLANPREMGEIYLDSGNITHATLGKIVAEPSIYQMLAWHHCEFRLVEDHAAISPTVTSHWQEIMLEGARKIDEMNA